MLSALCWLLQVKGADKCSCAGLKWRKIRYKKLLHFCTCRWSLQLGLKLSFFSAPSNSEMVAEIGVAVYLQVKLANRQQS